LSEGLDSPSFVALLGLGFAAAFLLGSCGSREPAPSVPKPAALADGVSKYLPFEGHTVLSYLSRNDLGEETLVVMEIERPHDDQGEIWIAGHRQSFSIRSGAIERAEGGFLLREPLEVGESFQGPFGRVTIVGLGEVLQVPAGEFRDCLRTREEGESPPRSVETTYCAGVGIAKIVISGAGGGEVSRVESVLTAHGPRIDLRKAQ
jgi:hypothetical protein